MNIATAVNTLLSLRDIKCEFCGAVLIVQEKSVTIIKNRLLKIYKNKAVVEIKCRECGKLQNLICNN